LNTIFNPSYSKEKLDLNTVDVLFVRDYTYQMVYSCEEDVTEVNYLGSVINYKRKPIKGTCVLVKIKLSISDKNKLQYEEAPMNLDEDIGIILRDLMYHKGFKISSGIEEFEYDNKYVTKDMNLSELKYHDVSIFGIPFRIWYVEGINPSPSQYLKDVNLILNVKVKEVYITTCIYPQCKTLSFDLKLLKQFVDLITTFPDEGELKDITMAYNYSIKDQAGENVFVVFDDFYWKVIKDNRS
jgi:hypothetical protein